MFVGGVGGGPHHRLCLRPGAGYYMLLMCSPPPRLVSPSFHKHGIERLVLNSSCFWGPSHRLRLRPAAHVCNRFSQGQPLV